LALALGRGARPVAAFQLGFQLFVGQLVEPVATIEILVGSRGDSQVDACRATNSLGPSHVEKPLADSHGVRCQSTPEPSSLVVRLATQG